MLDCSTTCLQSPTIASGPIADCALERRSFSLLRQVNVELAARNEKP